MAETTDTVQVTIKIQGLSGEPPRVMELSGKEKMSRLFSFDLTLAAASADIDFSSVIEKEAVVTITGREGPRYIHGIIAYFQQRGSGQYYTVYHARLVPRAWRLLHSHDCRIFQKKSVEQIIKEILDGASVEHSFRSQGAGKTKREYCVQYRESDWAFICRLLEEEGLFYYFEHKKDEHVLQMGDNYSVHGDIAGKSSTVNFHKPDANVSASDTISMFCFGQGAGTGKVVLRDYNFLKPALEVKGEETGSRYADLELYDYPGLFDLPEAGAELARANLERQRARQVEGLGHSDCPRFVPGCAFTLDKYNRRELNQKRYVLTEVIHQANVGAVDLDTGGMDKHYNYRNGFSCVPREVTYRPEQQTPRPKVRGVQTAVVTGPKGEEIYTDKHGRVKVQFHWDRLGKGDEKSSCWVRVNQVWTGQGWGFQWIPRVDQEVIVDFIEGDPDRPMVIGMAYHATNVPPYDLPGEKTKSTIKSNSSVGGGGSNEIRFEDKKDNEELYIHAQRDHLEEVGRNSDTKIGLNRTVTVEGKQDITVKGGNHTHSVTGGNKTVTISGDYTLNATKITETASSTMKLTGNANAHLTGNPLVIVQGGSGAGVMAPHVIVWGTSDVKIMGGKVEISGAPIRITGGDITITGGTIKADGLIKLNC